MPRLCSQTSSSWLTAHLSKEKRETPLHHLLDRPDTISTHSGEMPLVQPSSLIFWCAKGSKRGIGRAGGELAGIFFFLVSRTRHHSCAGHCFTIGSHCNFFRNATIPPGRIKQQKKTKQPATKQNQQRNTNQTQTENQTPEWKLSSLFLYNVQLK